MLQGAGKFRCMLTLERMDRIAKSRDKSEVSLRVGIHVGEDGFWVAECFSIPGCMSQGRTVSQALKNVQGAIQDCLTAMIEDMTASAHRQEKRRRPRSAEKLFSVVAPCPRPRILPVG